MQTIRLLDDGARPDPAPALRAAITGHHRADEIGCVRRLMEDARLPAGLADPVRRTAETLVAALRRKGTRGAVEGLVREFSLSSQEGVALMCLAEALLRIPDTATRDALIRDKIGGGDWRSHLGHSSSLFVNAATWGLVVTGKLTAAPGSGMGERGLGAALTRLIARGGEPLIRRGVDLAMRMMGEQFVAGQTIEEALERSRATEARGFLYSYDMLGEAATTAEDAARFLREYETAIHAIGRAGAGKGPHAGPGISIKLSALHPRYGRSQRARVMVELLPRVAGLAALAKTYDIGLNIDAEEQDRLELSLDILEALSTDPALSGWDGLGFVVQAYGRRCPFVIDWLIDLARRTGRRLMVRLVKGAYWDSEIKRAQTDGLDDFPVFTRKPHTDVSYLACARKLLAARDAVFPQFATHNAQTLAAIYHLAGPAFRLGDWEFQCLHGMGEPLYEEVVGHNQLARPCRIYAPVGTHETLLAYLVRRLLENGANSSFVNRIGDEAVPVGDLVADPVEQVSAETPPGAPHERILAPRDLFGSQRPNSRGLDLSDEDALRAADAALAATAGQCWIAAPPAAFAARGEASPVSNPADRRDRVGLVTVADPRRAEAAAGRAAAAAPDWAASAPEARGAILRRAADGLEANTVPLCGLLMREAGKSLPNAISEVREAVDFLRYYAAGAVALGRAGSPLGTVLCISPWNFPLAIFTGQVAAALAAGNAVVAKPAEETPLVAAEAVRALHAAGVPPDALLLLPGDGTLGGALVRQPGVNGVMFTGSTAVAKQIEAALAERLNPGGDPVPLVAETGGLNAMVVDSSALAEQVVADVLMSAFDSAGQRCSALRVLCLQEEVADRTLAMLRGALAELAIGDPRRLRTDIGPVISEAARGGIERHVATMVAAGRAVHRMPLPADCRDGIFVAPTLIELRSLSELKQEVFGPVLHVVRFARAGLDGLLDEINASGYGLTFGLHTRLDDTTERVVAAAAAGNVYVNRNMVGAVVGVQPFGGHGRSGTGPKAGGPLYLHRLRSGAERRFAGAAPEALTRWVRHLRQTGRPSQADRAEAFGAATPLGWEEELPGPVGERNRYELRGRGAILCQADDPEALLLLVSAALATGNRAVTEGEVPAGLDGYLHAQLAGAPLAAALFAGTDHDLIAFSRRIAGRPGAVVPVHRCGPDRPPPLFMLVKERSISSNTTAAGGNAHLMMLA